MEIPPPQIAMSFASGDLISANSFEFGRRITWLWHMSQEPIQCTKPEGIDSFSGQVVAPFCPLKGLQQL